jgi:putative ABC transport system permease protein
MLTWLRVLASRLHATFAARRLDDELDDELRAHLSMLAEENRRRGMDPEEAARAARRRLGQVTRIKEDQRRQRGIHQLEILAQDVRYAWRTLLRSPSFTLTAVATLALGIGAATAMYSLVEAVLLRPLPMRDAHRLVFVTGVPRRHAEAEMPLSAADYLDLKAAARSLASLAVFEEGRVNLGGAGGEPEQVPAAFVSADFFAALGVEPALGRSFVAEEDRPHAMPGVILADRLWRRRFGADPAVLGRTINLDERRCVVVGVLPPRVAYPSDEVELWRTLQLAPPTRRGGYFLFGVGRLAPGVALASARAELDGIGRRLQRQFPLTNGDFAFRIVPLRQRIVGGARPALLVLSGAVVLILLIACANVASLHLARGLGRRGELTLRAALGAGRARLLRQLLTESAVLALAGGALGVLLAWAGLAGLKALAPAVVPRLAEAAVDRSALACAALLALATAAVFALAPAWGELGGGRLAGALAEKAGRFTAGADRRRLRSALVAAEVALSLVLLIGAGLLLQSFVRLTRVDSGVRPEHTLTAYLVLPRAKYGDDRATLAFWQRLLERVEQLPGVAAAGLGMSLPPDQLEVSDIFTVEGAPPAPSGQGPPMANLVFVSPGYFDALGARLLRGRRFDHADRADAPKVAIVSESLARRFVAGADPLGKRIRTGGAERPNNPWMEIVGVVGDLRYDGLALPPAPALFQPIGQSSWSEMYLVVRSSTQPAALVPALRRVVAALDPGLPLAGVRTMDETLAASVSEPRFRTLLLGAFSVLALLLATVGVYGLVAYTLAQRTHELGIRVALGASSGRVLRLVLAGGLRLIGAGVAIGLLASLALTRLASSLLFGVTATDPPTFLAAALLLSLVALLASFLPARRATRLDPAAVLRSE